MNRDKCIILEPTRRITMCVVKPTCYLLSAHFNGAAEKKELIQTLILEFQT